MTSALERRRTTFLRGHRAEWIALLDSTSVRSDTSKPPAAICARTASPRTWSAVWPSATLVGATM